MSTLPASALPQRASGDDAGVAPATIAANGSLRSSGVVLTRDFFLAAAVGRESGVVGAEGAPGATGVTGAERSGFRQGETAGAAREIPPPADCERCKGAAVGVAAGFGADAAGLGARW